MIDIRAIAGAAILGLLFILPSKAATVTFDAYPASQTEHSNVSTEGLTITTGSGAHMYVWDATARNSNGTNGLLFAGDAPLVATITKTGGGAFDLISIDFTLSFYPSFPTEVITVNGVPLVLAQGFQTYDLNLMGVTQVVISGTVSGTYWLADNVVFDQVAAVPEPSTWAMMILGFAGVGFMTYRRRKLVTA